VLLPEFVATVNSLLSEIKEISDRNKREASYVFDTILQSNSLTKEEVDLATTGVIESGDRGKLILKTLKHIKNAMMELDHAPNYSDPESDRPFVGPSAEDGRGKIMYYKVPFEFMPKGEPNVNTNNPLYNLKYLNIDNIEDEALKRKTELVDVGDANATKETPELVKIILVVGGLGVVGYMLYKIIMSDKDDKDDMSDKEDGAVDG
jgi:hypothetical protein